MLNITYQPKVVKPIPTEPSKYSNPVGVWGVETEGDIEGKSIKSLGIWKGHVAEIAFHLASQCGYTLQFTDLSSTLSTGQEVPQNNVTTSKHVWISFGIDSKTWSMTPEGRAESVSEFLNAKDQITVHGIYQCVSYYAGVCLVLKD